MKQQEPLERRSGQERFRRAHRLRSSLHFQRVRRGGRQVNGKLLALSSIRQPPAAQAVGETTEKEPLAQGPTRIGFSVSKRVGGAVVRNRVKRRLREATRRHLADVPPGWDIVITARASAAPADFDALAGEVRDLLVRARLLQRERETDRGTQ